MPIGDFEYVCTLGTGSYSTVEKVKRKKDGKLYAMKKVAFGKLSDREKTNALNEVRLIASINSPYITSYKEAFFEECTLCIIMEYAENGDLLSKIESCKKNGKHFTEPEIWRILIQITKGLKALHDLKIVHRDIKSANILLTKNNDAKLGDFNVSKIAKKGLLSTQTGTPYYASPEIWKDRPYDSKSDIWSLGVVIYEICCLHPPFMSSSMSGLYKKVVNGLYPSLPGSYSRSLANIIKGCLQIKPELRPSCLQVLSFTLNVHCIEAKPREEAASCSQLLNTIKLDRNFNAIQKNLPKPSYTRAASLTGNHLIIKKSMVEKIKGIFMSKKIITSERVITKSNSKPQTPLTDRLIHASTPCQKRKIRQKLSQNSQINMSCVKRSSLQAAPESTSHKVNQSLIPTRPSIGRYQGDPRSQKYLHRNKSKNNIKSYKGSISSHATIEIDEQDSIMSINERHSIHSILKEKENIILGFCSPEVSQFNCVKGEVSMNSKKLYACKQMLKPANRKSYYRKRASLC